MLCVPAVYFGGLYFLAFGLLVTVHASYEMMNMFTKKYPTISFLKWLVPVMCVFIVVVIYLSATRGLDASEFGIIIGKGGYDVIDGSVDMDIVRKKMLFHFWVLTTYIVCILICFALTIFKKGSSAEDMMASATTLTYCGLVLGVGICVEYIQPITYISWLPSEKFGGRSFIYIFSICIISDVVAYFFGSKFGKTKLCPEISPNKTVEGALAGLIVSSTIGTLIAIIPQRYTLFNVLSIGPIHLKIFAIFLVFAFSFLIGIASILGDLIASKFKRSFGIKDFGTLLPGHGGVLDRFDSLIFASATYYAIIQIVQLIILGVAI